jgi:hypothetical protein
MTILDQSLSFSEGWRGEPLRRRIQASALHLGLSAAVALGITFSLIRWLYPQPFFSAAGGLYLMGFVVVVDVVLGPAITLLIYDERKRRLRRDLWTIALIQIAALAYGLWATVQARPVFMTYVVDRFELVSRAEVEPEELEKAPAQYRQLRWGDPLQAYARRPESLEERQALLLASTGGVDLRHFLRYYLPLEQARPMMIEKSKPIAALHEFNPADQVSKAVAGLGDPQQLRFLPVLGKRHDLTAIIHADTGALVSVLPLQPW